MGKENRKALCEVGAPQGFLRQDIEASLPNTKLSHSKIAVNITCHWTKCEPTPAFVRLMTMLLSEGDNDG